MDGKQLKNSILQWAIQGKLVPQNPKDEPASVLLAKIRKEKESLVKQGKLKKKDLEITPIDDDEIPFEIPDNWTWCRMDQLTAILNGDRGKNYPAKSTLNRKGIPFISALNLDGKSVIEDERLLCLSEEQYNKLGNGKLVKGDIVVCIRGSLGKHGRYPYDRGAIASSLVILRPYYLEDIFADFIMLYLDSPAFYNEIKRFDNGTAQPNLAAESLKQFYIPLPPLAEQKRIIAKLEQVLPLAEEYGAAQEQLDKLNKELPEALKKSILQEAIQGKLVPQNPKDEPAQILLERIAASRNESSLSLPKGTSSTSLRGAKATKQSKNPPSRIYRENGVWYEQIGTATPKDISDEIPFEIPENWVWCRLEKIVSINGGFAFKSGNYVEQGKGVRVLRISDFNENGFVNTKKVYHPYDESLADYRLSEKDIVMCMTGGTVGKTMYVTVLPEPMLVNQRVADISIIGDIESKYVYQVMSSNVVQDIVLNSKNSTNDNISMELIKNFLIPLPPLAEQKRIVAKLEQLFKVL